MNQNQSTEEKEENESYMQVAIRIRPMNDNRKTCLQYIPESNQIIINKDYNSDNSKRTFSFDYIFGPSASQESIYNQLCPPLIDHFLDGINITVFAYGQTGTGKTYTMGSEVSTLNSEESVGIIPRVIQGLYHGIEEKQQENNEIEYVVKITFIEIYQEQLRDLLHPDTLSKDINIWENNNTITISGVQEEVVNNLDEILSFIEQGTVARMTGTTNVHLHSSRSHAIFTIILEQYLKQSQNDTDYNKFEYNNRSQNSSLIRMSKFHLVDLAGSERVKKTGAEGIRFKESVKINTGLLALGNVISSLSMDSNNNNNNEKHIPYRDSKLTRLLQDSLGGNSKTIMIACVSPSFENYDESLNTLKYAQRARKIKNKPIINNINLQALKILTMKQKIEELESKLDQSSAESNSINSSSSSGKSYFNINEEYDDEEWLEFFINEFKNRSAKGTNAIKELNDLKEENEKILNELNQIKEENELRDQNKEKIKKENINLTKEIEILNYHNNEMINDLNNISYYSNLIANNILLSSEQRDHFNAIVSKWINYENNNHSLNNMMNHYDYNVEVPPNTAQSTINENKNNNSNEQNLQIIEDQKKLIKELEEESEQNNQILDQYKKDIENLQNKLFETSKSIEINDEKIKKLEKIRSELEIENESLKDNNNELKEKIYSVETTLSKVTSNKENKDINEENNLNNETENSENNEKKDESDENPQKEGIMVELDMAIKAKVELTRELTKINKEFEKSKHNMSNEIQKLERELENTKGELIKAQNQSQEKDNQRDKMKEEYEKKLKIFENQLTKSRSRQKGYDKIKKENALFERKNQTLQGEIEKITNQLSIYKKKTKDDSEKLSEIEVRKSKEIALLQKQIEDDSKQLRQQDAKLEMLRKKLDRKIEENNSLSKKLKDHMILYDNVNLNSKKNRKQSRNSESSIENSNNKSNENNNNNNNGNNDNNNENNNSSSEKNNSKESKNQDKSASNILKKSKIAKINLNKIKLSNTLNYTIHEIKRRLTVINDTLNEKKKELENITDENKEEKKVCSFMIDSLNKEKDLLSKQLEQIQKKNNVTFKTEEVQTEPYNEYKANNTYQEVFDEKQKEEYEDYIETLENERLQLNERLNNIISDHNREIKELKELYEQRLYNSQHSIEETMKDINNESLHENENSKTLKNDNQEYIEKISLLEQDNKFFKEKQRDLKKKLREFANENNHLISVINKEKIKNSKLKNYIQNVLNIKKQAEEENIINNNNNNNNDNNTIDNTNEINNNDNNNTDNNSNINITDNNNNDDINNAENPVNNTNDSIDKPTGPYHRIRSQEKYNIRRKIHTSDAINSTEKSLEDNNIYITNNDINDKNINDNLIENNNKDRIIKASRKSLKSNQSSESTLVSSESEMMSASTSISDLTKVTNNKYKINNNNDNNNTVSNTELSLPVIYLKATDNNSIVKAKNDKNDSLLINNNIDNDNNNNNNRKNQQKSIINNNEFLPSISTTTHE